MNKFIKKMKLEEKFFNAFFYPFLICVILSTLIVTIILAFFINNNDDRTNENIINLEKKYSKMVINQVNNFISTKFQLYQSNLNEIILMYQKMAKEVLNSNQNLKLDTTFLKCLLPLDYDFCDENEIEYMAYWLLDNVTTEENLDDKIEVKQQLIAYSNIISNINSIYEASRPNVYNYYIYFEKTELYISYPLLDACDYGFIIAFKYIFYEYGFFPCLDENGEYYSTFKLKCETFFRNILKSKTGVYDNNYLSQNRTIFVTNYHNNWDYDYEFDEMRYLSMCIEFDDPITNGKGYACVDYEYTDMVKPLENFNSQLTGYYFISFVGFSNLFFFHLKAVAKTSTDEIFRWADNYILDEKSFYHDIIRKIMSSNYIEYIGDSIYDEVYINGQNSSNQTFFVNGKEYNYSIFPVIFDNLNGKKEHIFSIIYVYNNQLFLDKLNYVYTSSLIIHITLELLLFIVFGFSLLYIIYLTLNTVSKHIVIPVKNVIYMLKGINIGGKNRLEFLDFLEKKRNSILQNLENVYMTEDKINNNKIEKNKESDNNLKNIDENEYEDNENFINKNINSKELINQAKKNFSVLDKKYDEESNYIEKEFNFYDFDEQLLQYRPLEIQKLMKSIMNIRKAFNLTSEDRETKKIINYSNSENIFRNFKNKKGAIICQSNIGNLQSQLLKYDKAIYHLVLSLQDNNIKKFINKNLTDELDEDNSLLKKIANLYNKEKRKVKSNILSKKQMNNTKNDFSQKLIGILINSRYNRLIHAYYMFFKNMQKLRKLKDDIMNGKFMNTKFHTINYYQKILIQFIYLSYVKNDLVKIGESILDYIEFLIKFKFKASSEDNNYLKIYYNDIPEYKPKQEFKKKIFDKIISWFNVFDDYISYIKDNSSLADTKCIVDDYSHNINNENFEYNLESQTASMFRINIQKSNFLKGKFCLCCQNYNDALYYFISAAKKDSIVIDGLIKKRSLKHIYKLTEKMEKIYINLGLKKLNMEKELKIFHKDKYKKSKYVRKTLKKSELNKCMIFTTFEDEISSIKEKIYKNIEECNAKQERDIIILIDFNIYNKKEKNLSNKENKIDAFFEETIDILNNYLCNNDRLSVLIYENIYKIICPLMYVNQIDCDNFSKELLFYKNKILDEIKKKEEIDINFEFDDDIQFQLDEKNEDEHSEEDSFELSSNDEINYDRIKGLVDAINYINKYSRMKEGIINEKYLIIFTTILNIQLNEYKQIEKIIDDIKGDKISILLMVGKHKINEHSKNNEYINNIEELILSKYGIKSEVIYFENMKKIKTILSNNKVIKDEIFYPNEIYK